MTAQLTKIRNAALRPSWFGRSVRWVHRGQEQGPAGITIPLFQCHGLPDPKYIELAGTASEGDRMPATKLMVGSALPMPIPEESHRRVHPLYKTCTGTTRIPHQYALGLRVDAITIVANAMKKAGTDPKGLRAAIEQTRGMSACRACTI